MGDGYWSQSGCNVNGHTRPDVWWYGVPGQGCWYWRPGGSTYGTTGPWFVGGSIYQAFAVGGYECGGAGFPIGPEQMCPDQSNPAQAKQRFQVFEAGRFVVYNQVYGYYGTWYQAGMAWNWC